MLNLSVSRQRCTPFRPDAAPGPEPRPQSCHTCGAPGGPNGELLDRHVVAQGKVVHLCPMCHACLHLDVAGRFNAGRIIWLPEISQEALNLLCLASFITISRAGALSKLPATAQRYATDVKPMVDHAIRLLRTFEKRAEALESFLGGNGTQTLLPRQTLSSPTHIASLIVAAQRETKLDTRTVARRLEGLRLLPNPRAFTRYVDQVSRLTGKKFSVDTWMPRVQSHLDAMQAASQAEASLEAEGVEHFDAAEEAEQTLAADQSVSVPAE